MSDSPSTGALVDFSFVTLGDGSHPALPAAACDPAHDGPVEVVRAERCLSDSRRHTPPFCGILTD